MDKISSGLTTGKKMKKEKKDPREGCELCLMNYGMESVKHDSICASRRGLAVIAGGHRKPNFILIFPHKHIMLADKVKKNAILFSDMENLIHRAKKALIKKYMAKKFKTTWCNGGMLLRLTGDASSPVRGTNSHADCKMDVSYR